MSTSSDESFMQRLALAQRDVFRFGGPVLVGVGTLSCLINLGVFLRKTLRKNPCSIYLFASNLSNLLLIYTTLFLSTLSTGFDIDPGQYNLIFCRVRFYAMFLFDILSPTYLIFASVDRILFTSQNARTRQRSTPRLAYTCIAAATVFWLLFHVHALVLTEITETPLGSPLCYFQPGLHIAVMGYYAVLFKGILVPLLMIILGLWAVKNVRSLSHVTPRSNRQTPAITVVQNVHTPDSKDRQLLKILLVDVSIYIIFSAMIAIVLIYQQFDTAQAESVVEVRLQAFLLTVGLFSSFIPFCIGCYTNFFVSKTFRREVKNILMCKQ